MVRSFKLEIDGNVSDKTLRLYVHRASWFAGWLAGEDSTVTDWADVTPEHIRLFFGHLKGDRGLQQTSRNSIGRSLQAFFKFYAMEEDASNPMLKARPPSAPKLGSKLVPVVAGEQLAAMLADAERDRKDFEDVRDVAMLRLFSATGGRLSELALLELSAVDLDNRRVTVIGKGGMMRTVPVGKRCVSAVHRYIGLRSKHKLAGLPALWLPVKGSKRKPRGLTTWGVRQALQRRARRLGIALHPHMFRHTFASEWLDNGGNESDLLEICGWTSGQMLKIYGRSMRSKRAARAYDRVMTEA